MITTVLLSPRGLILLEPVILERVLRLCLMVQMTIAVLQTKDSSRCYLYGLEFGNQIIFDYGIKHLEITLGTFDENRAYSSQINRGMYALSYAIQIVPEIDKLDYAFQKAFGLDFLNMKTPHGVTPGEVYKELLLFANEPQRMLYYFYNNGYGGDRRAGDFEETIARIVAQKAKPSAVWGAFTLEDYYLREAKWLFHIIQ